MLSLEVEHRIGDFDLAYALDSRERVTGLFGPSLGTLIGKPPERARELTLQMLMGYFEGLAE